MRLLTAMLLLCGMAASALAEKRLALVIGNDDYAHVAKLQKAVNDAKAMAQTLKALGFQVTETSNVNRREMNFAVQQFVNQIGPGDVSLVFFAGHGVEINGENFLLPTDIPDARPGQEGFVKDESVSLNGILLRLKERKSRLNIVVLDACRNNPFTSAGTGRSLGATRGLARVAAPQGTFVMYSADAGEEALDRLGSGDVSANSVFTRTLIPLLKTPGLDLVDIARTARRQVRKLALGVSHQQTPAYYDAVLGDFFFSGESPQAIPAPKPSFQFGDTRLDALVSQLVQAFRDGATAKNLGPVPLPHFANIDRQNNQDGSILLNGDVLIEGTKLGRVAATVRTAGQQVEAVVDLTQLVRSTLKTAIGQETPDKCNSEIAKAEVVLKYDLAKEVFEVLEFNIHDFQAECGKNAVRMKLIGLRSRARAAGLQGDLKNTLAVKLEGTRLEVVNPVSLEKIAVSGDSADVTFHYGGINLNTRENIIGLAWAKYPPLKFASLAGLIDVALIPSGETKFFQIVSMIDGGSLSGTVNQLAIDHPDGATRIDKLDMQVDLFKLDGELSYKIAQSEISSFVIPPTGRLKIQTLGDINSLNAGDAIDYFKNQRDTGLKSKIDISNFHAEFANAGGSVSIRGKVDFGPAKSVSNPGDPKIVATLDADRLADFLLALTVPGSDLRREMEVCARTLATEARPRNDSGETLSRLLLSVERAGLRINNGSLLHKLPGCTF